MFADLKKTPIQKRMPFSAELTEHTKFMSLDTWLQNQIKARKDRLANQAEAYPSGARRGLRVTSKG